MRSTLALSVAVLGLLGLLLTAVHAQVTVPLDASASILPNTVTDWAALRDSIAAYVARTRDMHAARLVDWIAAKPLQGNESHVQRLIAEDLRALDGMQVSSYDINVPELEASGYLHSPRRNFEGSPIVIGQLWPKHMKPLSASPGSSSLDRAPGRQVILNAHVDVVPSDDPRTFDASYDGQRVHGRGSTDMLGGMMCSLVALKALQAVDHRLQGPVVFQSVVEEESGGAGTLSTLLPTALTHYSILQDAVALIPEPTNMRLFSVQQGSTWFRITVTGKPAHGATRYDGISAIERTMKVMETLLAIEEKRNAPLREDLRFEGMPIPSPINVGRLRDCGDWPSSVPATCVMEGRLGILPGEDVAAARAYLERELREALPEYVTIEFFGAAWPSGMAPADHKMISILREARLLQGRKELKEQASPWATDGGYLWTVGHVPALVIGPGDTSLAHQKRESISMDVVNDCAVTFAIAMAQYLQ